MSLCWIYDIKLTKQEQEQKQKTNKQNHPVNFSQLIPDRNT